MIEALQRWQQSGADEAAIAGKGGGFHIHVRKQMGLQALNQIFSLLGNAPGQGDALGLEDVLQSIEPGGQIINVLRNHLFPYGAMLLCGKEGGAPVHAVLAQLGKQASGGFCYGGLGIQDQGGSGGILLKAAILATGAGMAVHLHNEMPQFCTTKCPSSPARKL